MKLSCKCDDPFAYRVFNEPDSLGPLLRVVSREDLTAVETYELVEYEINSDVMTSTWRRVWWER